jgi:hypothetical protein
MRHYEEVTGQRLKLQGRNGLNERLDPTLRRNTQNKSISVV